MRAVGIRELKARLSRYLRDVQAGEVVLVTDRGRVVAELRPPGTTPVEETSFEQALRRLADSGSVRFGEAHDPAAYPASPLEVEAGTAQRLIDEERGGA